MRLPHISSEKEMFAVFGADQLLTLAKNTGLSVSDPQDVIRLYEIIKLLTNQYSPHLTGVVFSPEIGYTALLDKAENAGPLFCLERRLLEPDPLGIPLLMQHWNAETVRNNYGVAKLELFFNPQEAEAQTKLQMVNELYDYCQHLGIDFLLELVIYIEGSEKDYQEQFQQIQLEAIQQLRRSCSVLALEFPLDALGAVTVTAELDIPWILAGRDTPYEEFKEQVRTALDSGAKGFLATEQFLPQVSMKGSFNWEDYQRFVQTTGKDRVIEMRRIVDEAGV